jgi:probable F420-dependent oxidoreductase
VPPPLDLTTRHPTVLDGPVGLWTGTLDPLPPAQVREVVTALDEQGWGGLWFGEAYGREAFTNAAMLLGASSRLPVATGIANIYARDAMAMAGAAKTIAAQYPGRFVCGMGVSHAPLVERMRGHEYAGPVSTMRAYLDAMATAPFAAAGPEHDPPLVLAALGPKMIELARERTAGVHPYLVTPEWTESTRELVGPAAEVAVMQAVVLDDDVDAWQQRAHGFLEIYTGLPNYRNSWLRQGFAEGDMGRGGSDRLKQAMVVRGEAAIAASVRAHLDAGASHVCLQVLGPDAGTAPIDDWRRLADVLL